MTIQRPLAYDLFEYLRTSGLHPIGVLREMGIDPKVAVYPELTFIGYTMTDIQPLAKDTYQLTYGVEIVFKESADFKTPKEIVEVYNVVQKWKNRLPKDEKESIAIRIDYFNGGNSIRVFMTEDFRVA